MIEENYSLTSRNTLGLPVSARYFASASDVEELLEALAFARERSLPVIVLGGGSNTVLQERIDGLVIAVDIKGVAFEGCEVEVAAGENWHGFVRESLARQRYGLENLSLIPGFAGGAPIQNIGAYGVELDRYFVSLEAIDRHSLETVEMTASDCRFGYRDSIFKRALKDRMIITRIKLSLAEIFEPNLDYEDLKVELERTASAEPSAMEVSDAVCRIRRRKLPDPERIGNAGSFFKNPAVSEQVYRELQDRWPTLKAWPAGDKVKLSAAWMIDRLGFKGTTLGDAAVSDQHALVIVNAGSATRADVLALAGRIQEGVEKNFGVSLEIEPVVY